MVHFQSSTLLLLKFNIRTVSTSSTDPLFLSSISLYNESSILFLSFIFNALQLVLWDCPERTRPDRCRGCRSRTGLPHASHPQQLPKSLARIKNTGTHHQPPFLPPSSAPARLLPIHRRRRPTSTRIGKTPSLYLVSGRCCLSITTGLSAVM
jgi:hypothetical protein